MSEAHGHATSPSTIHSVEVVGGAIGVMATPDGTHRLITAGDAMRDDVEALLGPSNNPEGWLVEREQAYDLVHRLRTVQTAAPGRGEADWPVKPFRFDLHTTWGPMGFLSTPWRRIVLMHERCVDPVGLDAWMHKVGARWSITHGNWNVDKTTFDLLVLLHWRPRPDRPKAGPMPLRDEVVHQEEPIGASAPRVPRMVDGHLIVVERGRDTDKIDRAWYKANGRWHRARCELGEYFVFDLHDGGKGVFPTTTALRDLLRIRMNATTYKPLNGFILDSDGTTALHEAIALAVGREAGAQLRLVD